MHLDIKELDQLMDDEISFAPSGSIYVSTAINKQIRTIKRKHGPIYGISYVEYKAVSDYNRLILRTLNIPGSEELWNTMTEVSPWKVAVYVNVRDKDGDHMKIRLTKCKTLSGEYIEWK